MKTYLEKSCVIKAIAWDNESVLTSPSWARCYDLAYDNLGLNPPLADDPSRGKQYKKMLSVPIDPEINKTLRTFEPGLEESNYLQSYTSGHISAEEFWPIVCQHGFKLTPSRDNVQAIRAAQTYLLKNREGDVQDIPEIVEVLKSVSTVLAQFVLSNTNPEIYEGIKDALFLKCIPESHQLFSIFIKCRKPSAMSYQILIERAGLDPEQILFIDDKESNVVAARKYGIKGVVFNGQTETSDILIDHLGTLGIMISKE